MVKHLIHFRDWHRGSRRFSNQHETRSCHHGSVLQQHDPVRKLPRMSGSMQMPDEVGGEGAVAPHEERYFEMARNNGTSESRYKG